MTKEEMIELLKSYKINSAKLQLKEKELRSLYKKLNVKFEIEINSSGNRDENSGIKSKNKINDTVGNLVSSSIDRFNKNKEEVKQKIIVIESEIEELKDKVEEAEIRLNCLYYKEKEILMAYYVENRTAEDIAENLFFRLFNKTCSKENVYRIITNGTNIMLNL